MRWLIVIAIIFSSVGISLAQDTIPPVEREGKRARVDTSHNPRTATILSAVIPGAGQIYNRRYWKAPLVWAGMGISIYYIAENNRQFNSFKSAYLNRLENDTIHAGTDLEFYSATDLRTIADQYRRRRDLSYVFTALFYILNVVDATVDGHMYHFDVSEDLSFYLDPALLPPTQSNRRFGAPSTPGLTLTIKF